MSRKITYSLLCCFLVLLMSLTRHSKDGNISYAYQVSFAVKIGILPTGDLTQYAVMYYKDGRLVSSLPINFTQLMNIGTGKWPIPNSTTFYNFFEEKGLKDDTLEDGSILFYTAAFDSLWKIRFEAHPFNHQLGKGWSQGEIRPSLKQQEYIYNRYGVRGYDQDYFSDTSFFLLLKDVLDKNWIAEYKAMH